MRHTVSSHTAFYLVLILSVLMFMLLVLPRPAHGRPAIRSAFFAAYPSAVGSRLDDLPSLKRHCGVCHFDFVKGGARNPYGAAVEAAHANDSKSSEEWRAAILNVEGADPDADGASSGAEILDRSLYTNTPTFPGLNSANVGLATNVDVNEILGFVVPVFGSEMPPPGIEIVRQVVRVQ